MMWLVTRPIVIPSNTTLARAASSLRRTADEIALERCGASAIIQMAHTRVADALDRLSGDCLSTSQLPSSPEARDMWASGALPRLEVKEVGCLVVPPPPRR
jgi:hypothetical protein